MRSHQRRPFSLRVPHPLAISLVLASGQRQQELHIANQVRHAELHQHVELPHVLAVGAEVIAAQHAVELLAQHFHKHFRPPRLVDMASRGNGARRCCSWPGCPPRLRFWPSFRGGLGGLTISLEGGLEEVEEFLRAAANWRLSRSFSSRSCAFSWRRRVFSSSSVAIRSSAASSFSSNVARRRTSDSR